MVTTELDAWDPLPISNVIALFRVANFRWWISGGHALELHLDRSWRSHEDTDVGVIRSDAPRVQALLNGWDISVAAAGRLEAWSGHPLDADRHQNNLWCRQTKSDDWCLDITIGDGDGSEWIYRRDPSVRAPWNEAVLTTPDGVPYLAPELQLLFKSKQARRKDDVDASEVIPALEPGRIARLARLLPAEHPWQRFVPNSS